MKRFSVMFVGYCARPILIVFLSLFADLTCAQNPTPAPLNDNKQHQAQQKKTIDVTIQDDRGTDKFPLSVKILPSKDADEKVNEDKKERLENASTNRWGMIGTIVAALAAMIAAIISGCAIVASNRRAKEALHASQRPWVVADSIVLREPILFGVRGPYEINANVSLKNTGASLAKNVLMSVKLVPNCGATLGNDWRDITSFNQHKKIANESLWPLGVVIAPNQVVSLPYGWGGAVNVEEIQNGNFYLMGYVEYLDQFGNVHHTRFAFNPNGDSVHPWDKKTFVVSGGFHEVD